MKVDGELKLTGDIEVGGKMEVKNTIQAKNIKVGGVLNAKKIEAEEAEEYVEVGGSVETEDGVKAKFFRIGKRGRVHGSIRADRVIIGKEAQVEDIYGREIILRHEARARNVYGEIVDIESGCRINGEIKYTRELRMNERVYLAKQPQKVDKLPL